GKVIVDPDRRRALIEAELAGTTDHIDSDLVEEVVYLTEFPTPLRDRISDRYLGLPDEPIIECIRKNQKYFTTVKNGKLQPEYILIGESVTDQNQAQILSGNRAVLNARLEDVRFFWDEDRKQPLDARVDQLKTIVYQKGLGSIYDKVQRIYRIATQLAELQGTSPAVLADIQRAAALCKADLVSHMVLELPNLQGIMGGIYARLDGENENVSQAIRSQYLLRIPTGHFPSMALAVADRLDTVVSCFANNLIPSGSQDPWGVRRAANGVVNALVDLAKTGNATLSDLGQLIDLTYDTLAKGKINQDRCISFMVDRLNYVMQNDLGIAYDITNAVLAAPDLNIAERIHYATGLSALRQENPEGLKQLCETAVRVHRLSKQAPDDDTADQLPADDRAALATVLSRLDVSDFSVDQALSWAPEISNYFDTTLIMDPNPAIRAARLSFLKRLADRYMRIADFEQIAG
ncbi:glycine--tRNA ligase subunit beta, partial [bacterium]|nr:glycine--tRNA ligase subunit beta [bacterium]